MSQCHIYHKITYSKCTLVFRRFTYILEGKDGRILPFFEIVLILSATEDIPAMGYSTKSTGLQEIDFFIYLQRKKPDGLRFGKRRDQVTNSPRSIHCQTWVLDYRNIEKFLFKDIEEGTFKQIESSRMSAFFVWGIFAESGLDTCLVPESSVRMG
ncbi:hypothetical protein AVEN_242472-1 [Araneus ventricosus]|uniref:Uncharacterized protein n=1 Tax=Araneus ventricosus TaxID=182803 RepID=A0A4Y2NX39_ARAVE|nr:hypothetical protein AVEN_242472-1 [Araneus ventricosus]